MWQMSKQMAENARKKAKEATDKVQVQKHKVGNVVKNTKREKHGWGSTILGGLGKVGKSLLKGAVKGAVTNVAEKAHNKFSKVGQSESDEWKCGGSVGTKRSRHKSGGGVGSHAMHSALHKIK